MHRDKHTGYPRMIYGSKTRKYGTGPAAAARSFIETHQTLFGLKPEDTEIVFVRERQTPMGTVITLRQVFSGIPVYKGMMDIVANEQGEIKHITTARYLISTSASSRGLKLPGF
jgi:hypothetical protein